LDVLAVVAGGAIIAAVLSFGAGPDPGPAPLAVSAATAATAAPPTTAPPVADDPVAFVMNYCSLLPGNTDAAWALLSPAAQEAAGGRSGFDHFYGTIRSVSLQNVLESDNSTVDATVLYVAKAHGSTVSEPYRFVVGPGPNGRMLIQSFSRM
jgi:serine/threonine-protein kinase